MQAETEAAAAATAEALPTAVFFKPCQKTFTKSFVYLQRPKQSKPNEINKGYCGRIVEKCCRRENWKQLCSRYITMLNISTIRLA